MRINKFILLFSLIVLMIVPLGCRKRSEAFVIALGDNIRTIDPIGSPSTDAASERVSTLIFNKLVKKNEQFDYVGELASDIKRSDDGLTFTFTLRDGVKFHDGRAFSSADAKYTLDLLLANTFQKSASFFEGTGEQKKGYIKSVDAPDPKTLVVTLRTPWVGLLSNLVAIPIIAKDSYESQKTRPMGTGPFKFVNYDNSQQVVRSRSVFRILGGRAEIAVGPRASDRGHERNAGRACKRAASTSRRCRRVFHPTQ